MDVFVHCRCVCLFQVLECLCVNNWWLSGVPAEIHYPSSSLVYCSVEDVFPSEADSFIIRDGGLSSWSKTNGLKNTESADQPARCCFTQFSRLMCWWDCMLKCYCRLSPNLTLSAWSANITFTACWHPRSWKSVTRFSCKSSCTCLKAKS